MAGDGGGQRGAFSDFSAVAHRYDSTRDVPPALLTAAYRRLAEENLLPRNGLILDAGCGTGQMSLVLAEMGYQVRGYDVSAAMVALAQAKCRPEWHARYAVADVSSLPDGNGEFDAVVVSKLFMHIQDWQSASRELLRVLKPGGCLFHVRERGAFANGVRQYFTARAEAAGYTSRFLGVRDPVELAAFLVAQGCETFAVDMADLNWAKSIRYGEALQQLRDKLFAEFWYLPADAHQRVLDETEAWVVAQPSGADTVDQLAPFLAVDTFRKNR